MQSENLLAQFQKRLFIPHKVFSPILKNSFRQEIPGLYNLIIQQGQEASSNQVINGELLPLFVVFSFVQQVNQETLKQLIEGLSFKVSYKKDEGQTRIPNFCRFLDSHVSIDTEFNYPSEKYEISEDQKQVVFCKIIPINFKEDLNGSNVDICIAIEFESNQINRWISDKVNFYDHLLKNNLTIQKPQIQQFELTEELTLLQAVQFEYTLQETDNTDYANINYMIRCKKQMTQLSQTMQQFVQKIITTYGIPIHAPEYEIHNIELVLSKSNLLWSDQKFSKQAPLSILKHIQIKKVHKQDLPSIFEPEEEYEGLIQLSVDWQTILHKESEVQLPSNNKALQRRQSISQQMTNPQLMINTPLLIRWKFKDESYFTNSVYKINWQVQPVAELGVKVKEVVRYKQEGNEYLALKLQISNYSTQNLQVTMNLQPEIFGQRFQKSTNQPQPLQVLAVCLTTKQEIGLINACSNLDTLVRLRLINRGILHISKLQFQLHDKTIEVKMNFLHSYEQ